ncbi:hypothetical protein F5B20DRAFT_447734 [Whalleya microplaca]|nr:hypothetical protein F5B20DRAFT_447734 [Whalleya microplaca]
MLRAELPYYYTPPGGRLRPYEPPEIHFSLNDKLSSRYVHYLDIINHLLYRVNPFLPPIRLETSDDALVLLKRLEFVIVTFERSRASGEVDYYRSDYKLPVMSDGQLMNTIGTLAEARESLVNFFIFAHIYPPIRHAEIESWDEARRKAEDKYEKEYKSPAALTANRIKEAKGHAASLMAIFWGDRQSATTLPCHVGKQNAISDRAGWADRIHDKLGELANKIQQDPKVIRGWF